MKRAPLLTLALLAVAGYHNYPCPPVGIAEGESFRITVKGLRADGAPCDGMDVPRLQPGDTFTLVAGEYVDNEANGCTRLGRPGPPPFATDVLTSCRAGVFELGLECDGQTAAGCPIGARIYVGPDIAPGVNTIEDGVMGVTWMMAGSCNSGGCVDNYDVRIERLPP